MYRRGGRHYWWWWSSHDCCSGNWFWPQQRPDDISRIRLESNSHRWYHLWPLQRYVVHDPSRLVRTVEQLLHGGYHIRHLHSTSYFQVSRELFNLPCSSKFNKVVAPDLNFASKAVSRLTQTPADIYDIPQNRLIQILYTNNPLVQPKASEVPYMNKKEQLYKILLQMLLLFPTM